MDPRKPLDRLRFGTAGIPISCPVRSTADGVAYVRKLGLDCMEMEFVRGVNVKEHAAEAIKKAAVENDIALTCHAPYYINLNSLEKEKITASIKRILDSARISALCGGRSVVFHAAYYMELEKDGVYNIVKKRLKDILASLKDEDIDIMLRPETTGKGTQFGDLKELLSMSAELDGVMPCVDFAHLHARTVGKMNTYDEFSSILSSVEEALGKSGLYNMHMHMAGIEYGQKGEKNHLILKDSDFNYKDLMRALKDFDVRGTLVCESPNIEVDARLMQKHYLGLR
ncbi:hypothetical protein COV93_05435 [Candidatus Woesearchaeota archaeon CG11_big_fil_rev_8_21_14_0_20_43_8]|nr:MAG: hypothetical protein COV93_05435 [Candidatus Woesearchaeota archaeon CG11_big_fil_rev_8_21_14_0_20_43_8]PIO05195.1 MAG: hypothetical protein COT47_05775 [Candidatus Woesearchaeota archaeon CG08_land_8_20_14_0_20_43_7]